MAERVATLAQLFEQQAQKFGTDTFLKDRVEKTWRDHSWSAVAEAAGRLRTGLIRLGVAPGDRVAILSDNCPQWVIADQAVLGLGAIVVPLYTTSGAEETAHVLSDSGSKVLLVNGDNAVRKVLALAPHLPELRTLIAMHPGAVDQPAVDGVPAVMTMESAMDQRASGIVEGSREDLATFIYTSGTTGPSKGVMLTHGNILANCADALAVLRLAHDDTALSFLPVAHSFERMGGYYAMVMGGATIAYAENLTTLAPNMLEVRPTILLVVPRVLEMVYGRVTKQVEASSALRRQIFKLAVSTGSAAASYRNRGRPVPIPLRLTSALFGRLVFKRIKAVFGGRLRYLVSGGAPLPEHIFDFLGAAGLPIIEGYGLTEAAPVVAVSLPGHTKIGTVGLPLPSVDVKTAADGELLVRGPNVMKGYYKLPQETSEALDAQGWLHTGDIASIDAEGYIKITDRKKEIIVLSGGKNISPANLELKLQRDPCVAQACVIGDRRKHLAALIVPDFESLAQAMPDKAPAGKPPAEIAREPEVRSFFQARIRELNKSLSDIEAISAFALVAEPFSQENGEMTPSLKVRRKVVQQHYREQIEAMYRD